MKILFVYHHPHPEYWHDGLRAALTLLQTHHTIEMYNLASSTRPAFAMEKEKRPDFILGWGGFHSPVDIFFQTTPLWGDVKKGLCLAGNAYPLEQQKYDVIFYETEWAKEWLLKTAKSKVPPLIHAFGYNSTIFHPSSTDTSLRCIDYLTVGAFAKWKRQEKMLEKSGVRMAIGEIQEGNLSESLAIIGPLLMGGVVVGNMMQPEALAQFYRIAKTVYIPADTWGGGERAVLEAVACGAKVEVEADNPKLQELLDKKWDEVYYMHQLEKGFR